MCLFLKDHSFKVVSFSLSNYTVRVMPLPLHDITKVLKEGGVEEVAGNIQRCLSRNNSDERVKSELSARHRRRLLTATQQSVRTPTPPYPCTVLCESVCCPLPQGVMSRELVQLEDLLQWAERSLGEEQAEVVLARSIKEQANKVVQVKGEGGTG